MTQNKNKWMFYVIENPLISKLIHKFSSKLYPRAVKKKLIGK